MTTTSLGEFKPATIIILRKDGDGAIMLGSGDAAHEMFATDQSAIAIDCIPFKLKLGERKTETDASVSSKRIIRLFGMFDTMR